MELPKTSTETQLHTLVKNIEYSLRLNDAKSVLVSSDLEGEGKSTFLKSCTPIFCHLYKKRVLIFDFEPQNVSKGETHQFGQSTSVQGLDYVSERDLLFLNGIAAQEKVGALGAYFHEISKDYDIVFINMKTMRRMDKNVLPPVPIDGVILIRSEKSFALKEKKITEEIRDREIPILGIVLNEGI